MSTKKARKRAEREEYLTAEAQKALADRLARAEGFGGGSFGKLIHDSPSHCLIREVCLIDPVVEGLADVEHREHEQQQSRKDQRKLDGRLAGFAGTP